MIPVVIAISAFSVILTTTLTALLTVSMMNHLDNRYAKRQEDLESALAKAYRRIDSLHARVVDSPSAAQQTLQLEAARSAARNQLDYERSTRVQSQPFPERAFVPDDLLPPIERPDLQDLTDLPQNPDQIQMLMEREQII